MAPSTGGVVKVTFNGLHPDKVSPTNCGGTAGTIVMVMSTVSPHCPASELNVYVKIPGIEVSINGGFQVPVIGGTLFVTNGNTGAGETYVCNTVGVIIAAVIVGAAPAAAASAGLAALGAGYAVAQVGTAALGALFERDGDRDRRGLDPRPGSR